MQVDSRHQGKVVGKEGVEDSKDKYEEVQPIQGFDIMTDWNRETQFMQLNPAQLGQSIDDDDDKLPYIWQNLAQFIHAGCSESVMWHNLSMLVGINPVVAWINGVYPAVSMSELLDIILTSAKHQQ